MSQFVVTKANGADVDRITPLFDAYRQFYRQESDIAAARKFLTEHLRNESSVVLLCTEVTSGADVGFVQLYPLFSSVRMNRAWILNDLFVGPGARRNGVASRLLTAAADFARATGAATLLLETETGNREAQALYEKEGWHRDESCYHYSLDL